MGPFLLEIHVLLFWARGLWSPELKDANCKLMWTLEEMPGSFTGTLLVHAGARHLQRLGAGGFSWLGEP